MRSPTLLSAEEHQSACLGNSGVSFAYRHRIFDCCRAFLYGNIIGPQYQIQQFTLPDQELFRIFYGRQVTQYRSRHFGQARYTFVGTVDRSMLVTKSLYQWIFYVGLNVGLGRRDPLFSQFDATRRMLFSGSQRGPHSLKNVIP